MFLFSVQYYPLANHNHFRNFHICMQHLDRVIAVMKDAQFFNAKTSYFSVLEDQFHDPDFEEVDRESAKITALNRLIVKKRCSPADKSRAIDLLRRVKNYTDMYPDLVKKCNLCNELDTSCRCKLCIECDGKFSETITCGCGKNMGRRNRSNNIPRRKVLRNDSDSESESESESD
jgi:hypothetical protein